MRSFANSPHQWATAGGGPLFPTQVVITGQHSGWGFRSTNLTLIFSNGVYAAGTYTVAPTLISNLIVVAKCPWPKPGSNVWPSFTVDPVNLGLDAGWLKTNYQRLLQSYFGKPQEGIFRNASARQQAWLTNALSDMLQSFASIAWESLWG